MIHKIIILFTLGLSIILFIPAIPTNAASVFIGITVDSAKRSDGVANFCLANNTKISIMNGSTPVGTTNASTVPACAGDTLWSNLISLTSGTNYTLKLDVPGCYAPVYFNTPWQDPEGTNAWLYTYNATYAPNNSSSLYPISTYDDQYPAVSFYSHMPKGGGAIIDTRPNMTDSTGKPICWIAADEREDCNQACATAGMEADGLCNHYDLNCEKVKYFLSWKFSTTTCHDTNGYPRYSYSAIEYQDGSGGSLTSDYCDNKISNTWRTCQCKYNINTFNFPFTPVF